MTPRQFIEKGKTAELSERSAYQQHFPDICELLDERKPADVDPIGIKFTLTKGEVKSMERSSHRLRFFAEDSPEQSSTVLYSIRRKSIWDLSTIINAKRCHPVGLPI